MVQFAISVFRSMPDLAAKDHEIARLRAKNQALEGEIAWLRARCESQGEVTAADLDAGRHATEAAEPAAEATTNAADEATAEATTEAATFANPSEVTKEVDNLVASTAKEEEGTQVTGEGSAGSTKPTEVWTLRPNWSTVGSTLQEEEETTIKVLTTIGDATEVTSSPTEQVTTIGESVTTEAAENITPAVTETVKAENVTPTVTETVKAEDRRSKNIKRKFQYSPGEFHLVRDNQQFSRDEPVIKLPKGVVSKVPKRSKFKRKLNDGINDFEGKKFNWESYS